MLDEHKQELKLETDIHSLHNLERFVAPVDHYKSEIKIKIFTAVLAYQLAFKAFTLL